MSIFRRFQTILALVATLSLTGCLFRTHKIDKRLSSAALREASLDELVNFINAEAARVQTLNATVDIAPSIGGAKKGKVTDFQDMRGYVLVRKPAYLRMIGLFPILRNKAFDMVSDGSGFRLSLPTKNRFVVGPNELTKRSDKPLENLRPQHIFEALLVQAVAENEIAVLEESSETVRDAKTKKEVEEPNYVVHIIRRSSGGWRLARKVVFSRADLLLRRQTVYDEHGAVATDAEYANFADFDGIPFPSKIRISRPQEEYAFVLSVMKLRLNEPLSDEQFLLEQPPGSELQRLDRAQVGEGCCAVEAASPR